MCAFNTICRVCVKSICNCAIVYIMYEVLIYRGAVFVFFFTVLLTANSRLNTNMRYLIHDTPHGILMLFFLNPLSNDECLGVFVSSGGCLLVFVCVCLSGCAVLTYRSRPAIKNACCYFRNKYDRNTNYQNRRRLWYFIILYILIIPQ